MPVNFKLNIIKQIPPTLVAILIFINGLVNIIFAILPASLRTAEDFSEASRLFSYVAYRQASTIVTIIIGLLLIWLGVGLYQRYRRAWIGAIFILIILNVENIIPTVNTIPLSLGLFALITLLVFYRHFRIRLRVTQTHTVIAWLSVVFAMAYGSIGCYLMRAEFSGICNFTDAFYYTLVTYSTVGYGDVTPLTNDAKLFVITMIFVGLGAFATVITVLLGPMLERRLKRVFSMVEHFNHMRNHAIFCGVNQITIQIAKDLAVQNIEPLFISSDAKDLSLAEHHGFETMQGDVTEELAYKQLRLADAKYVIIAGDDDGQNIFVIMAVKTYLSTHGKKRLPETIVILDKPVNAHHATQAGADRIIIPAVLASNLVINQAS